MANSKVKVTPGIRKIMEVLLANTDKEFTARTMARASGLELPTARRYLRLLDQAGWVSSRSQRTAVNNPAIAFFYRLTDAGSEGFAEYVQACQREIVSRPNTVAPN